MFQSHIPCPECGSYYRLGERKDQGRCNKCATVINEPLEIVFTGAREYTGRKWSKEKHRYLTQKEITSGE